MEALDQEATEDSLETSGEDLEALDKEEQVTEQQATTTRPAGP